MATFNDGDVLLVPKISSTTYVYAFNAPIKLRVSVKQSTYLFTFSNDFALEVPIETWEESISTAMDVIYSEIYSKADSELDFEALELKRFFTPMSRTLRTTGAMALA